MATDDNLGGTDVAKYMLLIYSDIKRWADARGRAEAINGEYFTYTQELIDAGVMVGGDPLERRTDDGQDRRHRAASSPTGPSPRRPSSLGGYYVIEVADEAAALEWAGKLPGVEPGPRPHRGAEVPSRSCLSGMKYALLSFTPSPTRWTR